MHHFIPSSRGKPGGRIGIYSHAHLLSTNEQGFRHKRKDGFREESDDDRDNDFLFLATETVRWIKDKRIHGLAAIWVQMDA